MEDESELKELTNGERTKNNNVANLSLITTTSGLLTSVLALVFVGGNIFFNKLHQERSDQRQERSDQRHQRRVEYIDRLDKSYTDSLYQLHENLVRVTKEAFDKCFAEYKPQ